MREFRQRCKYKQKQRQSRDGQQCRSSFLNPVPSFRQLLFGSCFGDSVIFLWYSYTSHYILMEGSSGHSAEQDNDEEVDSARTFRPQSDLSMFPYKSQLNGL